MNKKKRNRKNLTNKKINPLKNKKIKKEELKHLN